MGDFPSEAWDFQVREAAAQDDLCRIPGRSRVPPILRDLVLAARTTSLNRFHPFTSHATIRFSTGARWWLGDGDVLPVAIALVPEGRYLVHIRTSPDGPPLAEFETADADEAERLVNATGGDQPPDRNATPTCGTPTGATSKEPHPSGRYRR